MASPSKDKDRPRRKRSSRTPEHERADGAFHVVIRNQVATLLYWRMIAGALFSLLAAGVSLVCLFIVMGQKVPPQYIPVSADGRLLPLIPLNKANQTDGDIAEFALHAVRELNNYDYLNWRTQVQDASFYFTPQGWGMYIDQFVKSNVTSTVEARKMIVTASPKGNVSIVNQGVSNDGVYTWRVELPMSITYIPHSDRPGQQGAGINSQEGVVTLYISRVPTTLQAKGIAVKIYQFALTRGGQPQTPTSQPPTQPASTP